MVRACHAPRQPLQTHPSGHLGQWTTPCDQQGKYWMDSQRVDIPAHSRTVHVGLWQKRLEKRLYRNVPHFPSDDLLGRGTEPNWTVPDVRTEVGERAKASSFAFFFALFENAYCLMKGGENGKGWKVQMWLSFPRLRWFLGECSTIHSPPALSFSLSLFFKVKISSRSLS